MIKRKVMRIFRITFFYGFDGSTIGHPGTLGNSKLQLDTAAVDLNKASGHNLRMALPYRDLSGVQKSVVETGGLCVSRLVINGLCHSDMILFCARSLS